MKLPLFTILVAIAGFGAAKAPGPWTQIGTSEQLQKLNDHGFTLNVPGADSFGLLSSSVELSGADSVLVTATLSNATTRAATFAMQDARTGQTVGYWQNSTPIASETSVAAVLELSRKTSQGRLFAGTHRQPSTATIRDIRIMPIRPGDSYLGSIYAAAVDGRRDQSQTFVARGKLAAISIRARHAHPGQDSQGLRIRIFEWNQNAALTRRGNPIAETTLPARLIPDGLEGNEKDISFAISAPTRHGQTYLISFGAPDHSVSETIYLWAGPEGYAGGNWFENDGISNDWDLYFKTYHE